MAGWEIVTPGKPKQDAAPAAPAGGGWEIVAPPPPHMGPVETPEAKAARLGLLMASSTDAPDQRARLAIGGGAQGKAGAIGRAALQGGTMNTADEIAASVAAAQDMNKSRKFSPRGGAVPNTAAFKKSYDENYRKEQDQIAEDRKKIGAAYTGVELGSSLLAPGLGTLKATSRALGAAKPITRWAGYAGVGGLEGGAQALAAQDKKDVGGAIATGALPGMALGGGISMAGSAFRAAKPFVQDLGVTIGDIRRGASHQKNSPGTLMPIHASTERQVAKKFVKDLHKTGINDEAAYIAAAQAQHLPGAERTFATTGGDRIKRSILTRAEALKDQPSLAPGHADNYIERFNDSQLNPNGVSQQQRLTDDILNGVGYNNPRTRDQVSRTHDLADLVDRSSRPLDALRNEAGLIQIPRWNRLYTEAPQFRAYVEHAIRTLDASHPLTALEREALDNGLVPKRLALQIRDHISDMVKTDKAPTIHKRFLDTYEELLGQSGAYGRNVNSAYDAMSDLHGVQNHYKEGLSDFSGDLTNIKKRHAESMRIDANATNPQERQMLRGHAASRRQGAVHSVTNRIADNFDNADTARRGLFTTPEGRRIFDEAVTNRNVGQSRALPAMSGADINSRLQRIGERQAFSHGLRDSLGQADLESGVNPGEAFDAYRRWKFSPGYSIATWMDKLAKRKPQARIAAETQMALDPNMQRRVEQLMFDEMERQRFERAMPKNMRTWAYSQALLNSLNSSIGYKNEGQ